MNNEFDPLAAFEAVVNPASTPYEDRAVDLTELDNKLIVSTVFVNDLDCYETAILTKNGIHPVERYDNKDVAKAGHISWVTFCEEEITLK